MCEAAGALQFLRYHREHEGAQAPRPRSGAQLAKVVEPPLATPGDAVGTVRPFAPALPAAEAAYRPLVSPSRSKTVTRRAGCRRSARPDPWGAGRKPRPPRLPTHGAA